MKLIDVKSARQVDNTRIDMIVTVDLGDGEQDYPFTYDPADPHGLAPAVREFLSDNPSLTIAPYVPPPEVEAPPTIEQQFEALKNLLIEKSVITNEQITAKVESSLKGDLP